MSRKTPERRTHPAGPSFRDVDAPWCPELTVVAPGSFRMGSTDADQFVGDRTIRRGGKSVFIEDLAGTPEETPAHPVTIAHPFAAGRYPVTFEEFGVFIDESGREPPEFIVTGMVFAAVVEGADRARRDDGDKPAERERCRDRTPVVNVSREDAEFYLEWLRQKTGKPYRLLSESEWEYAARRHDDALLVGGRPVAVDGQLRPDRQPNHRGGALSGQCVRTLRHKRQRLGVGGGRMA